MEEPREAGEGYTKFLLLAILTGVLVLIYAFAESAFEMLKIPS